MARGGLVARGDGWPGRDRELIHLRFIKKKNDCINQFYVGFRVKV